jgi:hypothetical protein
MFLKSKFLPTLMAALLLFPSCEKGGAAPDRECYEVDSGVGVISISGPPSAYAGTPFTLTFSVYGRNGCAYDATMDYLLSDRTISLRPNVKYKGCGCYQALKAVFSTMTITLQDRGTYTFSAMGPAGELVNHTVRVW